MSYSEVLLVFLRGNLKLRLTCKIIVAGYLTKEVLLMTYFSFGYLDLQPPTALP